MSQTFINVLPTSTRVLVASSDRGMTTFVNYSSEIMWLGDGVPAVVGQGIRVNPNGASYVMASALGNLSYRDIFAIHDDIGPEQLCINQETANTGSAFDLLKIGAVVELNVTGAITAQKLSLDPADSEYYWINGLSLNAAKNAFVVSVAGRYQLTLFMQVTPHATGWSAFFLRPVITAGTFTGGGSLAPAIPPATLLTFDSAYTTIQYAEMPIGGEISFEYGEVGLNRPSVSDSYFMVQYVGPATSL